MIYNCQIFAFEKDLEKEHLKGVANFIFDRSIKRLNEINQPFNLLFMGA